MTRTLVAEPEPHAEAEAPAACCTSVAAPDVTEEQAQTLADVFKALADPTRVRIVNVLVNADEPVCVCDFTSQPRPVAAHGELPPGEAPQGRTARSRAARHVGLLLAEPLRARARRPGARPRRRCGMNGVRHNEELREEVRARYAASARAVIDRHGRGVRLQPPGHDLRGRRSRLRGGVVPGGRSGVPASRRAPGKPGLRQPDGGGRSARRRHRPRSRLRRRHRRPALRATGRADRQGLRPGHDRGDARARPREQKGGRRDQRRVPQGLHRGHPAAGVDRSTS